MILDTVLVSRRTRISSELAAWVQAPLVALLRV
jgi:hypothetical protein